MLPRPLRPARLMRLELARRKVESESESEVEPPVLVRAMRFEGNSSHGRSTAGMYMGRPERACWPFGDGGVE